MSLDEPLEELLPEEPHMDLLILAGRGGEVDNVLGQVCHPQEGIEEAPVLKCRFGEPVINLGVPLFMSD